MVAVGGSFVGEQMTRKSEIHAPYLSEEAICDLIEKNHRDMDAFTSGWDDSYVLLREVELGHKYRADFIQIGRFYDAPAIRIHEVKITATAYSISQVERYKRLFARALEGIYIALDHDLSEHPIISGSVLAVNFDTGLSELFHSTHNWMFRIKISHNKEIKIFEEEYSDDFNLSESIDFNFSKKLHEFSTQNLKIKTTKLPEIRLQ